MDKTSRRKKSITVELLNLVFIPVVIVAVVASGIGAYSLSRNLETEKEAELKDIVSLVSNNYSQSSEGDIDKIISDREILDYIKDELGYEATVFKGDVRAITTIKDDSGNYIDGTKASSKVVKNVIEDKTGYFSKNVDVNGENYYGYYLPIIDKNGDAVGMYFVGTPASSVSKALQKILFSNLATFAVVFAVIVVFVVISSKRIANSLTETSKSLVKLASGELNVEVCAKAKSRRDEIGEIARATENLKTSLFDVISSLKTSVEELNEMASGLDIMASQTSATTDEVSHAINDISQGALSQAEDTSEAVDANKNMAGIINEVVDRVNQLTNNAEDMARVEEDAAKIIDELSESNDRTIEAVERIGSQTDTTNKSAHKIKQAIEIITEIASETSLLSLNASIEAARAGEQGRGFSVVASEIQKLAEQSDSSAKEIEQIIEELLADSEKTVDIMREVKEITSQQEDKLSDTKDKFFEVGDAIGVSIEGIEEIKDKANNLDMARERALEIIQSLSAVSEENAASTEETTASTQELNATIAELANTAALLEQLGEKIHNELKVFKL